MEQIVSPLFEVKSLSDRPKTPPASCEALMERALHELSRYYRHSSAGLRVSGIVHQMNGPLQVLSMQLELLELKTQEELRHLQECPPPLAERLGELLDYRRGKIHQFRQELEKLQAFARRLLHQGSHEDHQDRVFLDLNQVYQEELELYLAHPFYKNQVTKHFRFQEGVPLIQGHCLDFSQSFRNIVDNALEAMEAVSSRELTVETSLQNGWRMVRIGDTGVGIEPEVLPRIFEPFFTTKGTPEQPRAGLGLFMARRLLAPYEGEIQVTSRPGETWMTVRLPVKKNK